MDNSLIPRRRATVAASKQPVSAPIPVGTSSVTQRLQKELMSLLVCDSFFSDGRRRSRGIDIFGRREPFYMDWNDPRWKRNYVRGVIVQAFSLIPIGLPSQAYIP